MMLMHIVSAWASDQHLTLGQTTVDKKSNKITAIPQLLEPLTLSGAIVTIDATGCQRDIAAKIIQRKGHYCLAVKGNQEKLHEPLKDEFEKAMSLDRAPKRLSKHEVSDAQKKPDVTFREDESRIRKDHGAENVSWLRRLAVTLIKHNQTRKASIRQKRLRAGYDFEFLLEILNSVPVVN